MDNTLVIASSADYFKDADGYLGGTFTQENMQKYLKQLESKRASLQKKLDVYLRSPALKINNHQSYDEQLL